MNCEDDGDKHSDTNSAIGGGGKSAATSILVLQPNPLEEEKAPKDIDHIDIAIDLKLTRQQDSEWLRIVNKA